MDSDSNSPLLRSRKNSKDTVQKAKSLNRRLLVIIFSLHFLINFTWYFLEVPLVRLFEYAVCERYYRSQAQDIILDLGAVDEGLCKVELIQDKVAILVGGKISLEAMASMFRYILVHRSDKRSV